MRIRGLGGNGRTDYGNWSTLGYVTAEADEIATPRTLSYAFDDGSIARLAQCILNRGELDNATKQALENTAALFSNRSQNYRTQWEPNRRLMCPRFVNGTFTCPPEAEVAVPYPLQNRYLEGDVAQWLWFVPQDPAGLATLFPSNANANDTMMMTTAENNNNINKRDALNSDWHILYAPQLHPLKSSPLCR